MTPCSSMHEPALCLLLLSHWRHIPPISEGHTGNRQPSHKQHKTTARSTATTKLGFDANTKIHTFHSEPLFVDT